MVYGLNFNGVPIPDAIQRKFSDRMDSKFRRVGKDRGCAWRLVGVATDADDKQRMLNQANNGHRKLHVVERKTAGGLFFGIYVG